MRLSELAIGKDAVIEKVETRDVSLRKHILEMGLTPGVEVSLLKMAPLGDPIELRVRGYNLTLRKSEAENIEISGVHQSHDDDAEAAKLNFNATVHPNLGEERQLPRSRRKSGGPLSLALVGNQNCGKTTLFNQLTGSNQHVGNFPGVTVDRKDGQVRGHKDVTVTDLPGIYSLAPYTSEEIVTRDFIIKNSIDGIINIVDATNIERNLYLTTQLMELDKPMVIALNMMDEVRENGGTIDINALEEALGVPIVPISASKNEGIGELIEHIVNVSRSAILPRRTDFCLPAGKDHGAVHRAIHGIEHLIQDHAEAVGYPVRFAATQICQDDHLVVGELNLEENEKDMIGHILSQMEEEAGVDRMAAIVDMKFSFIETLTKACVVRPRESREQLRSQKIDKVLTGKYTALPCFALVMALTFYLTFGPIGGFLSDGLAWLIGCGHKPHRGRHLLRRGHSPVLHAIHRHPLLLPLHAGGLGLHGPCGLRHGPPSAQAWPVRTQLRAHARRLRLLSARHHELAHLAQREGQEDDRHADPLHVMLGQAAHLRLLLRLLLP